MHLKLIIKNRQTNTTYDKNVHISQKLKYTPTMTSEIPSKIKIQKL